MWGELNQMLKVGTLNQMSKVAGVNQMLKAGGLNHTLKVWALVGRLSDVKNGMSQNQMLNFKDFRFYNFLTSVFDNLPTFNVWSSPPAFNILLKLIFFELIKARRKD